MVNVPVVLADFTLTLRASHFFTGKLKSNRAVPGNDPSTVPSSMLLCWKSAVSPANEPFAHLTLPVSGAAVADRVTQEKGLSAKDPENFPEGTIVCREGNPWVVQPDNTVFSLDALVPPPDFVSGGENLIVAENEQLTEPTPH